MIVKSCKQIGRGINLDGTFDGALGRRNDVQPKRYKRIAAVSMKLHNLKRLVKYNQ